MYDQIILGWGALDCLQLRAQGVSGVARLCQLSRLGADAAEALIELRRFSSFASGCLFGFVPENGS